MIKAEIKDAPVLYSLFRAFLEVKSTINLIFSREGLNIKELVSNGEMLISVFFPADKMRQYNYNHTEPTLSLHVQTATILSAIGTCTPENCVRFSFKDKNAPKITGVSFLDGEFMEVSKTSISTSTELNMAIKLCKNTEEALHEVGNSKIINYAMSFYADTLYDNLNTFFTFKDDFAVFPYVRIAAKLGSISFSIGDKNAGAAFVSRARISVGSRPMVLRDEDLPKRKKITSETAADPVSQSLSSLPGEVKQDFKISLLKQAAAFFKNEKKKNIEVQITHNFPIIFQFIVGQNIGVLKISIMFEDIESDTT